MSALRQAAAWLVRLEIPILLALYAYFILTDALPPEAIILLFFIWAMRAWLTQRISTRTAFDLPIIFLMLLLPFNLSISPSWFLSLPKIYGIIFGIAFYYAIVNHISSTRDLSLAIFWLSLLALAIAIAGLIGTDWAQSKIISASFIYDRLPRFIQGIPRSIAGGFARNGIGGTLTFTIPLLAAMLYTCVMANPNGAKQSFFSRLRECLVVANSTSHDTFSRWVPLLVSIALLLSLFTLALTQSRGGILGVAVGLLTLIVWKNAKFGLGILVAGLILIVSLLSFGRGSVVASAVSDGTLASRMEVWQRGLMMVQDFPFTGIGIGTYNQVAHALYPFFIAAPNEVVPHAHNQFIEVAVDLGIPGLIAYIALLVVFFYCAARAYRGTSDAEVRGLIVGLVCGMVAHHVFGLTDAFILGSKPGLLMWVYFAMVAKCYALWAKDERPISEAAALVHPSSVELK